MELNRAEQLKQIANIEALGVTATSTEEYLSYSHRARLLRGRLAPISETEEAALSTRLSGLVSMYDRETAR